MGKKNSKEAKALRKAKVQSKRNKFNNPVPRPKEYVKHFGYVPNEPRFYNAAIAWSNSQMNLALRTKEQIVSYVKEGIEEGYVNPIGTRSGKQVVYVSCFRTGDYSVSTESNGLFFDCSNAKEEKSYYALRHVEDFGSSCGESFDNKNFELNAPFFFQLNTFMIPVDNLDSLPEKAPTNEELIALGKQDESVQAMNELELDNLLCASNESTLRENYEFNENGLIIEEFNGEDGEVLYQPKKKEETWLKCTLSMPFMVVDKGIMFPQKEQMETYNIHNGGAN